MNALELYIYNLVKRYPRLKTQLGGAYRRACALLPVKKCTSLYEFESRPGYFFGYFDKSPWSHNNALLLSHRFSIPVRMPADPEEVHIGYFQNERFKEVGRSTAWNWQQGAMLQWLGNRDHIIFNISDGRHYRSRIVDLKGREIGTLPRPVAAVNSNGTKALSYNFSRLRRCAPSYAYACAHGHDFQSEEGAPATDGLYALEIPSGNARMICSLQDLAHYQSDESMQDAYHYFNHCSFSPSGDRLVFLHRWQKQGREWTRMLTCGFNGADPWIFPTAGMVSHFTWKNDQQLLAWAHLAGIGDRYFLFRDLTYDFLTLGENCLNSDGHPTFSRDGRWIITDTYPDRFRISQIVLYDTHENKPHVLAQLHSPLNYYGDVRCDLHPRWNRDDTMICFDSSHNRVRSLCTMKLHSKPSMP